MSSPPRTLLIASVDRLLAEAAAAFLGRDKSWRVLGTIADGLAAMAAVARTAPDVVLVIGEIERITPEAFAQELRRRAPEVNVIFLASEKSRHAVGIPWDASAAEVVEALRSAPESLPHVRQQPETSVGLRLVATLTKRERTVLRMLAAGLSMDEIASELELSDNTIRTHMQNLYAKLGCHNRLEVVQFALNHGVVDAETLGG